MFHRREPVSPAGESFLATRWRRLRRLAAPSAAMPLFASGGARLLLALLAGLCIFSSAHAGTPPWPNAPFSYYAKEKPLKRVLEEFAANFSLKLSIDEGYREAVDGRFNAASPSEFIDHLGGVFGFQWFTHAGTLYVSPSSAQTMRTIALGTASPAALRQALTALNVIEPRFGFGELPEQGAVVIAGPPAYVALVESVINSLPEAKSEWQVRVFRLRHATVVDRIINYRDREIRFPGIARVLRDLVQGGGGIDSVLGDPAATLSRIAGQSQPVVIEDKGGPRDSRRAGDDEIAPREIASPKKNAGASIQADPRINAIIVMDRPERIPLYERLVAMLDVQNALVEIEAMIIDVNSTRLQELGIAWNSVGKDGRLGAGYGSIDQKPDSSTISIVGAGRGGSVDPNTLLVSGAAEYFMARLRALEREGDAAIQSRPSILTEENVEALIDLSQTFYVRVSGERVASLTPITAGTTLKVTPRLVRDADDLRIWMAVDIEDGGILEQEVDKIPAIRRSMLSTQTIVRPDESLLIGGYNTEHRIKGNDKVPLLGDIPLFGALFSSSSNDVQRRERLFMIRPKLVEIPGGARRAPDASQTPPPMSPLSYSEIIERPASKPQPSITIAEPEAAPESAAEAPPAFP